MFANFGTEALQPVFPHAIQVRYFETKRLPLTKGKGGWASFYTVIVIWRAIGL